MDAARDPTGRSLRQGRDLWRADPRRTCGEQSGPAGAGPRIRDAIRRPDVSRAGKRARLVRRGPQKPRARARRAVALRGRGSARISCSATPGRRFKPARINTQFAYMRRRIRRTRPYPVPVLCRAGGDVLPGRPVRLAHDRYQQFQAGIKRHAFKMRTRIGVDRATGKIIAFAADHVLDGGGLANFSGTRCDRRRPRRSASTTFRKSMSPRSRCIRAA